MDRGTIEHQTKSRKEKIDYSWSKMYIKSIRVSYWIKDTFSKISGLLSRNIGLEKGSSIRVEGVRTHKLTRSGENLPSPFLKVFVDTPSIEN